jgi:hypothetical protein
MSGTGDVLQADLRARMCADLCTRMCADLCARLRTGLQYVRYVQNALDLEELVPHELRSDLQHLQHVRLVLQGRPVRPSEGHVPS